MVQDMEKAQFNIKMEIFYMKVILLIINMEEMENILINMAIIILVNLKMV